MVAQYRRGKKDRGWVVIEGEAPLGDGVYLVLPVHDFLVFVAKMSLLSTPISPS
jgi:hypothetical protein